MQVVDIQLRKQYFSELVYSYGEEAWQISTFLRIVFN